MKYSQFLQIILILAFLLTACSSPDDRRLEQALVFAGNHREELEKVLSHYAGDSLKQAATRFLIMNMTGHTGYDPAIIPLLQPVYQKLVAISQKYDWKRPDGWRKEIDELWNKERVKINLHKYPDIQDAQTIKADWLIKEIDLVFKAWKENVYTENAPFEVFCKYILPYRFSDKFCIDDNRKSFYDRHHGIFDDTSKDFREVTDSLHFLYSDIMNSFGYAASMPICDITRYEQIKRGICDIQTQFNAHLMSALGMAVTIDFVPMWGNRSEGHSWNALIVDGKTHPFEPFWNKDRWKYDKLYSNSSFYEKKRNRLEEISDVRITANVSMDSVKELYKIVDGLSGTGFWGSFYKDTPKEKILTFYLGKETEIAAISIIPKPGIQLYNQTNYTLYYWDNKWIQEKTVKVNGENITFENIPSEALYLIKSDKPADSYFTDRIFTYKDGRIYWW